MSAWPESERRHPRSWRRTRWTLLTCSIVAFLFVAIPGSARSVGILSVTTRHNSNCHDDGCTYTVRGKLPIPPSTASSSDDQDTGSVSQARNCSSTAFAYDHQEGSLAAAALSAVGYPEASALLSHFLSGVGSDWQFTANSRVSQAIISDPQFQKLNAAVKAEAVRQWRAGQLSVDLTPPKSNVMFRLNFEQSPSKLLQFVFGGTQGLEINGSATLNGGKFRGLIQYVIRDTYGFHNRDYLHVPGFGYLGRKMHYLQSTCGYPPYKQAITMLRGAHPFFDSAVVVVPISS